MAIAQLTDIAVLALPAGETGFVAVLVASVVAERVVARPAESAAIGAVIVGVALHPDAVGQAQSAQSLVR